MENPSSFFPTEQRLAVTAERYPAFPTQQAVLSRLIRHVHKLMLDQANNRLRKWDLSLPEYNLLMMLYGTQDRTLSASALRDAAGEKFANLTRLADCLIERGLINRSQLPTDRRVVTVSLTAQGEAIVESLLPEMGQLLDEQMSHLGSSEQWQLEGLLKKVLAGLES